MDNKFICWAAWKVPKWGFWFRIFGYGLVVTAMHPMFSERNGMAKVIRVFGIKVAFLRP